MHRTFLFQFYTCGAQFNDKIFVWSNIKSMYIVIKLKLLLPNLSVSLYYAHEEGDFMVGNYEITISTVPPAKPLLKCAIQ